MIKHLPTSPNFPQLPRLRVALGAQHRRLRRQLPRAEQLGSCPTGAGDVADLLGATEVAGPAASCEGLRKRQKPGIRWERWKNMAKLCKTLGQIIVTQWI